MSETTNEEIKTEEENSHLEETAQELEEESVGPAEDENVAELKPEKKEENWKEKYYYLAAEMENQRRRFEREKDNLLKYGNEKVLKGMLDVIDNLERTLQAVGDEEDEKIKNIVIGVEMVRNQFLDTLKGHGLEEVEALGQKFDPNFHEAMAQQPHDEHEDEVIITEYQKGYKLNGRLLRASKVVIVKN